MATASTPASIAECLAYVCDAFERHGIWHALTYGTLIGALREGDVIAWDYDFDLYVRPADCRRIVALSEETRHDGFTFKWVMHEATSLAVNARGVTRYWASSLVVQRDDVPVGDLYAFTLFNDGVLRRIDPGTDVYYCPHSSIPYFFLEELGTATLRGRRYPVPREAEQHVAFLYGDDWRIPYRAVTQGGEAREGHTTHSDLYEPRLDKMIAWCEARGWDRGHYRCERAWPREIAGAGPFGPTPRTFNSSRALWWRDLAEVVAYY